MLRIERQPLLRQQNPVEPGEAGQLEREKRERIRRPTHFPRIIDAADCVCRALDREQDRRHERPLAFKDTIEIDSYRFHANEHGNEQQRELQPPDNRHFRTSPDAASRKSDKRRPPRKAPGRPYSRPSSDSLASADVAIGQKEEDGAENKHADLQLPHGASVSRAKSRDNSRTDCPFDLTISRHRSVIV